MRLTPRQRDVALLVSQGLTNDNIAERLGLGETTIKNTVSAIYQRLGFSRYYARRVLLTRYVLLHGLEDR